jgi:hypothetical protein
MLVAVVPDAWVYQAANKLIEQHDDDALKEATRLFFPSAEPRPARPRAFMLRVRLAVSALQAPAAGVIALGLSFGSGSRQRFQAGSGATSASDRERGHVGSADASRFPTE